MKISSSHLALRFYMVDGWTAEAIKPYILSGIVEYCPCEFGMDYYRPDIGARLDCKKMIEDGHTVTRWSDLHTSEQTDLQYLEGFQ